MSAVSTVECTSASERALALAAVSIVSDESLTTVNTGARAVSIVARTIVSCRLRLLDCQFIHGHYARIPALIIAASIASVLSRLRIDNVNQRMWGTLENTSDDEHGRDGITLAKTAKDPDQFRGSPLHGFGIPLLAVLDVLYTPVQPRHQAPP